MKKRAIIFSAAILSLFCSTRIHAQGHADIYRFSNYEWSFGTARSAAMGGAFSSLGADLSSPMMNPAGLGMYRRSEIGISPSVTILNTKTNHPDELGTFSNNSNKNRFAFNNFGAAFNVYNGSGGVTSITLGMTYNKLIDNNTLMNIGGQNKMSIGDYFEATLNEAGVGDPDNIQSYLKRGQFAGAWGGMLGWEAKLGNYNNAGEYYFFDNMGTVEERQNAYTTSNLRKTTNGSAGQFDISMGMNFTNKFYLGFGFGFQDIYYKERNYYNETAHNNIWDDDRRLNRLAYYEYLKQSGSAWNFKIGAIARPIDELRLGLAFHTPTYINIDETYGGEVSTDLRLRDYNSGYYSNYAQYRLRTPMRLIGGASYTFYNTAILSIDYERIWYNQMKLFWDDWDDEIMEVTEEVKNIYKASHNLRVGLETMIAPNWFARVGFAWYGSMYKDNYLVKIDSDWKKYDGSRYNYSAGFGYRTANWGIDLAYIFMDSKDAPEYVYGVYNNDLGAGTTLYKAHRQRNNITLTASLRF